MAVNQFTPKQLEKLRQEREPLVEKYGNILETTELREGNDLPIIGKFISNWKQTKMLEAFSYFFLSGDPVVDDKLKKSFIVRDDEMKLGLVAGAAWGSLFALLPAWRGYPIGARIFVGLIPFSLSVYRGYRRGVDHVLYVGETFMELHLRRRAVIKNLLYDPDSEPEFYDYIKKSGQLERLAKKYRLIKERKIRTS
ncbi:unnamed protein product [Blepharisma stoltei]|uniref:Uncharacterized protein n=1 Tax=Blepharisma stoltei TaxID=1481888 RepID=A0AAU9KAT1_9CILI|nr:unnamed protein product [Blepharisma stoltei]